MPRFAHITQYKAGSQWVADVLGDRRIAGAQGAVVRRPDAAYGMRQFRAEPDRTLATPMFGVLPYEWQALKGRDDRCVVVLRDPRDLIVSWAFSTAYSHVTNSAMCYLRPTLLELDLRGKLVMATLAVLGSPSVSLAWAEYERTGCELVCRFEDLVADEFRVFRSIVDHFGWRVGDDVLREVVGDYTFAHRSGGRERGEPDAFSHLRNATPGDWRNYFDRRLAERFENVVPGLMRRLGYEQRDDWWQAQPEFVPALEARDSADELADVRDELARVRAELETVRAAARELLERCTALEAVEHALRTTAPRAIAAARDP